MEITEVRIKLTEQTTDRLQAFCSVTLDDCFVVRDLKIIDGSSGPFVAMPSRKLSANCPKCRTKNHLKSSFCNHCGGRLNDPSGPSGKTKLYADIAHPINAECREMIQQRVLDEFQAELKLAAKPGYKPKFDAFEEFDEVEVESPSSKSKEAPSQSDSAQGQGTSNGDSGDDFGAGVF